VAAEAAKRGQLIVRAGLAAPYLLRRHD